MTNSQKVIKNTLTDGLDLINSFKRLAIKHKISYQEKVPFSNDLSKITCFVGEVDINNQVVSTIGCTQTYKVIIPESQNKEAFRFLATPLSHFLCEQDGFEFVPQNNLHAPSIPFKSLPKKNHSITQILGEDEFLKFKVNIHSFYKGLKVPNFLKRFMTRNFPMSSYVLLHNKLNVPLNGDEAHKEYFCYSFVNEKSGTDIWGFGPGKFEKGIKHYEVVHLAPNLIEITLTALISPRSEKVLNIYGVDPIYGFTKLLDVLTFKKLSIHEKLKTKIEMQMMKHHVKVHELMLGVLFDNQNK